MWGLLISFCAWHLEHPSSSFNNSQKAFLYSSVPGTSFPRQKCLGGNVPRVSHWRHQECQGRNPGGSPRNVSWGTYCTPYLDITVTIHPQFHGSWGLYDFLKKIFTTLLNDFHADSSIWLSRSLSCKPINNAVTIKSQHMVQQYLSYWIFSNIIFKFSYVSFMLVA